MIKRRNSLIVLLILIILFSGCVNKDENKVLSEKVISEENIGGKYNAKIVTFEIPIKNESTREANIKYNGKDYFEAKDILYTIGDKQFRGDYRTDPFFIDSVDWIKRNTQENSIFLNWWDYGHMIRGVTGRDVVIAQPSRELARSTLGMIIYGEMDEKTYEEKFGLFETPEKIKDVSIALTTDDITKTNHVMDKYNAKYIFTTMYDLDIISIMPAGESSGYYAEVDTQQGKQIVPSSKFYNSTLARLHLFKGKGLENYHLVYESQPKSDGSNEKQYKNAYNTLYGGDLQLEDSGYIKIFEYVK